MAVDTSTLTLSEKIIYKLKRLPNSISFRIQSVAIFLSFVGVFFGIKSYIHIKDKFGPEQSLVFLDDLKLQLVVVVIVNIAVGAIIFRNITIPIRTLTEVMRALTEDRLDIVIPYAGQPSEIGSMARKAEIFKKNALEKARLEEEKLANEQRLKEEKVRAMHDLADRFESRVQTIIKEVVAAISQLQTNSNHMVQIINNTNDKATQVVNTTAAALENVKSVAGAADVMSSSVSAVEAKIRNSNQSVRVAVESQGKADEVSKALSDATNKIGEITKMILDIAEQINLLALNATIESARAGEAGKGFAVVASEVKSLAGQTTRATDEISKYVSHIQQVSSQVINALSTIKAAITEVETNSSAISSAILQQTETTREIASSMGQVADHTGRISSDISEVKADSITAKDSSAQVLQVVGVLSRQSEKLNQEVSAFIREISAA